MAVSTPRALTKVLWTVSWLSRARMPGLLDRAFVVANLDLYEPLPDSFDALSLACNCGLQGEHARGILRPGAREKKFNICSLSTGQKPIGDENRYPPKA